MAPAPNRVRAFYVAATLAAAIIVAVDAFVLARYTLNLWSGVFLLDVAALVCTAGLAIGVTANSLFKGRLASELGELFILATTFAVALSHLPNWHCLFEIDGGLGRRGHFLFLTTSWGAAPLCAVVVATLWILTKWFPIDRATDGGLHRSGLVLGCLWLASALVFPVLRQWDA